MKKLFLGIIVLLILPIVIAEVQISFDKTTVSTGGTLIITYHQPEGQSYGIIQDIPNGWSTTDISPDGNYRAYIDDGSDKTLILTAPSSLTTSIFTGKYFVVPQTTYTPFQSTTITVGSGSSGSPDGFFSNPIIWIAIGVALLFIIMNKK